MGRLYPLYDVELLKQAALARLHAGEQEHLPSLAQLRERVFLDLAQNGIALYACPDHPLAEPDIEAVRQEVEASGWLGVYEPLLALAQSYPFHLLIVCAPALPDPKQTSASPTGYFSRHVGH